MCRDRFAAKTVFTSPSSHHAQRSKLAEIPASVARGMRCRSPMRISHLLTGVVIFTGLALGGLRFGQHQLPKPQEKSMPIHKAAVVAPVAALEAKEDQQPSVSTTDLAATTRIEGRQSDPVDGDRVEADTGSDPSTETAAATLTAPT